MELIKENQYLYTNTVKVGRTGKKMKRQLTVKYIGSEDNKVVFETEVGTELLIHIDDVDKRVKEVKE